MTLDMRPYLSVHDHRDQLEGNPVFVREVFERYLPGHVPIPNVDNVDIPQLSGPPCFAGGSAPTALAKRVMCVVSRRANEQMRGITAWRIVAPVQYPKPVWDWPVSQLPSYAGCLTQLAPVHHGSISAFECTGSPEPTSIGIGRIHARPESLVKSSRSVVIDALTTTESSAIPARDGRSSNRERLAAMLARSINMFGPMLTAFGNASALHRAKLAAALFDNGGECHKRLSAVLAIAGQLRVRVSPHAGNLLNRLVGCRAPGDDRRARVFACLNYSRIRHEMAAS